MGEFTVVGLRVLREVVRGGSFSAAADRLGYTQSAVSRQIQLMERAAGQALFERRARGVRPTEAGRLVARHAEIVLGDLDTARQELLELEARPRGRLRVGGFASAMAAVVPRAMAEFARRHPHITLVPREGTSPALLNSVARRRTDVAVVAAPATVPAELRMVPLLDDPLFVAVPTAHRLAGRTTVSAAMLRDERWIVGSLEPGTPLLGAWLEGTAPAHRYVVKDWSAKLGLVAAGLGVTVVPGLAVTALPAAVTALRIDHEEAVRPTVAVLRRESAAGTTELASGTAQSPPGTAASSAAESASSAAEPHSGAVELALGTEKTPSSGTAEPASGTVRSVSSNAKSTSGTAEFLDALRVAIAEVQRKAATVR
ncbi:LysR family transcriptional regulator [Nocardia otitidiscaviarum]|uniref:LysR family transcriptional regulator n=1 Tax=Nocardia otitidiscaviarum TaxID=1823 RepID=UPI0006944998|nr:LysR family transcriptional regulator [Nocardia otitidiscaviarum]MBF6135380.1 LysR family transcriptional regulator [Nocardia otitidiscaviarum]MBF6487202.1 LysR family transcriptional regulator [Nocardia otitidiscaviarum]